MGGRMSERMREELFHIVISRTSKPLHEAT